MIKVEVKNEFDYKVEMKGSLGVICTQLAAIFIGIRESVNDEEEVKKLIGAAISISEAGRPALELASMLAIEQARKIAGKDAAI